MYLDATSEEEKIIPLTMLRRDFGKIEKKLPFVDRFLLTKKGRVFAVLMSAPGVRREILKSTAGAFKGSKLDDDKVWKAILKKRSRKNDIKL